MGLSRTLPKVFSRITFQALHVKTVIYPSGYGYEVKAGAKAAAVKECVADWLAFSPNGSRVGGDELRRAVCVGIGVARYDRLRRSRVGGTANVLTNFRSLHRRVAS